MRQVRCVFVGKLKNPAYKDLAAEYAKRLGRYYPVRETCIKDAPGGLSGAERIRREGEAILAEISPRDLLVCLDERGTSMTSPALADKLQTWLEDPAQAPCFVVGGSLGMADAVLKQARVRLSLGPMTLPHELCRVVLLEQIYRAATILRGHPYHHE